MKYLLLLSALGFAGAQAEPWVMGAHLLSIHDRPGFETETPGLYLKRPDGITVGVLRNSMGRSGFYAGQTWEMGNGRWALTVGAIAGYPSAPLVPLLVPSWRVSAWQGGALRLSYLPRPPSAGGAAALHLSLEKTF